MGADALSDVLRAVRLTGPVFVTVDVSVPWSAPVPSAATLRPIIMPSAQHLISYHLVTEGDCCAVPEHGEPVRLVAGDVIVFAGGDPHVMCTDPKVPAGAKFDMRRIRPAEQWPYRIVGERTGSKRIGLSSGLLGSLLSRFDPTLARLPSIMAGDAPRAL